MLSGVGSGQSLRNESARTPADLVLDSEPRVLSEVMQVEPDAEHESEGDLVSQTPLPDPWSVDSGAISLSKDASGIIEQLKINQDQADCALKDGLKHVVEGVTRMMIKLHNQSVRVNTFVCFDRDISNRFIRGLTLDIMSGTTTILSMTTGKLARCA